jgi:hypothetical protein
MAIEVRGIDEQKQFKIGKLNLRGKSKKWFKKLATMLANWQAIKVVVLLKYRIVDKDEIIIGPNQAKTQTKGLGLS